MVTTKARLPRVLTAALVLTAGGTAALAWSERTTIHSSAGNSFTAATVVLTDDDRGTALFHPADGEAAAMVPGQQIVRCVAVVLATDATAGRQDVVFYASGSGERAEAGLSDSLELTVERGSASGTKTPETPCGESYEPDPAGPVFRGTLATFLSAHGSSDTGAPTGEWRHVPNGDEHVFRISVGLADDATTPGASVSAVTFFWKSVTT